MCYKLIRERGRVLTVVVCFVLDECQCVYFGRICYYNEIFLPLIDAAVLSMYEERWMGVTWNKTWVPFFTLSDMELLG
jgi:hypothetical protein